MAKKTTEQKRNAETRMVREMITLYCRKNHQHEKLGNRDEKLCPRCLELLEYSILRSQKCPFIEEKTFCSNCKVHCYKPAMREQIRAVMKFSGPRMLFVHPIMAIHHVICTLKARWK